MSSSLSSPSATSSAGGGAGLPSAPLVPRDAPASPATTRPTPRSTGGLPGRKPPRSLTLGALSAAVPAAVRKLDPRQMWRVPVMFVVEVGAALTTVLAVVDPSVFAW